MTTHVIFCIMPIHGHCTLMYLGLLYVLAVIVLYCWMAGSSPGSSSLHFWDGLIMYFGHRITPLTSHIRGHLLQLILPHMVDHTFMSFPIPLQTLWIPCTIFVPLMFPRSSLKTPVILYTQLLNPFSHIHADITLKPAYIEMCAKGQIVL